MAAPPTALPRGEWTPNLHALGRAKRRSLPRRGNQRRARRTSRPQGCPRPERPPCLNSARESIVADAALAPRLVDLGLEPDDLAIVKRTVVQPQGLVLVAGPVRGGRTSTLHAMLDAIDPVERGVRTIEMPAAWRRDAWRQWAPTEPDGLSRKQLRATVARLMAEDPGVLLLDVAGVRLPMRRLLAAAESGWLVFAPVAMERAVHVFGHYRARGIAPADLARSLQLVLAQRLVRTLCDHCAQPDDTAELRSVVARAANTWLRAESVGARSARPGGCERCGGSGHRGRALLYEVLEVGAGVRAMAGEGLIGQEMELSALGEGRSLWDHGIRLLARGRVSLRTLRAALREPG